MPRKSGIAIQNKFVRGFVTEATALSFPEDACTEVDNVVFDSTGRVTRRLGFDIEGSSTPEAIVLTGDRTHASFIWDAVSGDGSIQFLVTQDGSTLKFYDASTNLNLSANLHSNTIDLNTYLAFQSNRDPAEFLCQFASGNGDLIVVNAACDPIYIEYDIESDAFTATAIVLKYRDFAGLDDGLDIDERPTATLAGLETSNPEHYYNILNQGWGLTDALVQWDTARTDIPSNADYFELYRASATDPFDNARVGPNNPGNRPAPRGHFILDVGRDNRQEVLVDAGSAFNLPSDSEFLIDRTSGTIIGDFENNVADAFDGNTSEPMFTSANKAAGTVNNAYIGKDYGASDLKTISKVVYHATNDERLLESSAVNVTVTLYASNTLPANGTDGTALGNTGSYADNTAFTKTIVSNDSTTQYRYVWIYILPASGVAAIGVSEVQFYSNEFTFERPSCVAFYAGRIFYGGINVSNLSNNIYFSQIIEDEMQYGFCYQKNDPTTEIPDLLSDDGGVIKIPDMGSIVKLYAYQNALIVYAENGIWLIAGSTGSTFRADDYQVKKLSTIGTNAPYSIVSIKGLPAWWGEDGIYTIQFDPNYDSFTPVSLSGTTIDRFYRSLPLSNRAYVKGAYDEKEQIAYWVFNDDEDLTDDFYQYNSMLCLDAKTQAFYTWSISAGPTVRSIDFIKPADRSLDGRLKFKLYTDFVGSNANQTFAEVLNDNYIDWEEEGSNVDYESYFVTGFRLDGETQKFFQPNYVFVFLESETNASCFMQGIFDYTTSSAEGKWSTRQQIYNENLTNRSVNFRRLKVRGKGRALQLRFESEAQKPFTIIGWSLFESVNTTL